MESRTRTGEIGVDAQLNALPAGGAAEWILASASPRRAMLLRQLGVRFRVETASVEEVAPGHLTPREICLANATAKAKAVSRRYPDGWIIGADTEVALGAQVFGKPRDRVEAARFLRLLSGRTHQVITGVCLVRGAGGVVLSFAETTQVTFHPLTEGQIERYHARVDPLDKAGAYAVQDGGEEIIEAIVGSLTNVVGLPLGALRRAMARLG